MTVCDDGDSSHLLLFLTSFPIWSHHAWSEYIVPHQPPFCLQSLPLPLCHSFQGRLAAAPQSPGCSYHWRRIHSTAQNFQPPKHKAFPSVRLQGVPALWRTIILHGESYFLFPLGFLGWLWTPFLLTPISSPPHPQFLDWMPHPSGNRIHQVYPCHAASSQTWALFFSGFCDSATQYSISISSHSKPCYVSWLSNKRWQVVHLWVIKACCGPCYNAWDSQHRNYSNPGWRCSSAWRMALRGASFPTKSGIQGESLLIFF